MRAIVSYGRRFYRGEPAITRNQFGEGRAYYLGTALPDGQFTDLLTGLSAVCEVELPGYGVARMERARE